MQGYIMNKIMVIVCCLPLLGCIEDRQPEKPVSSTNEKSYPVDQLFEVEGCKMYRFYDKSEYRYFSNCQGSTSWVRKEEICITDANGNRSCTEHKYPRNVETIR